MRWRGTAEAAEGDAMVDVEEVGAAAVADTPARTPRRWAEIVVGESRSE